MHGANAVMWYHLLVTFLVILTAVYGHWHNSTSIYLSIYSFKENSMLGPTLISSDSEDDVFIDTTTIATEEHI